METSTPRKRTSAGRRRYSSPQRLYNRESHGVWVSQKLWVRPISADGHIVDVATGKPLVTFATSVRPDPAMVIRALRTLQSLKPLITGTGASNPQLVVSSSKGDLVLSLRLKRPPGLQFRQMDTESPLRVVETDARTWDTAVRSLVFRELAAFGAADDDSVVRAASEHLQSLSR